MLVTDQTLELEKPASHGLIGKRVKRKEDPRSLLGLSSYVDDIKLPRMVHVGFFRSSYAHARIKSLDLGAIANDHKVIDVVTGPEIANVTNPIPLLWMIPGCKNPQFNALAIEKVKFAGEPVVGIVVEDAYDIEDMIEKVHVEYQPLPPVSTIDQASGQGNSKIFEDWKDNVAYEQSLISGDPRKAIQEAFCTVSSEFSINRLYGGSMETRSVLADYDVSSGMLTVWSSTQFPHFLRTLLGQVLKHPESQLRVVAPDVGGGFGNKQNLYNEEVVTAYLAKKLSRPVKWVATRSEDISTTVHAREQKHFAQISFDKRSRIIALKDTIFADLGAYGPMSLGSQITTIQSLTGPYRIDNVDIELKCLVTNKVPTGAYRGFGQPEATFVIERLMDIAAEEMKIDRANLRMLNVVTDFPHSSPVGAYLDSGNYIGMLKRVLDISSYNSLRVKQKELENQGRLIGIGLAFGCEVGGIGPSQVDVGCRYKGYDCVRLRVDPDATVTLYTGLSPYGQGVDTILAQVCAEKMFLDMEKIFVYHGDTSISPYGFGSYGSRSAVIGSSALLMCIRKILSKMGQIATHMLGVDTDHIIFDEGKWKVKGSQRNVRFKQVAEAAYEATGLPKAIEPGLDVTCYYDPPNVTSSCGLHLVMVEIDPETDKVKILKYFLVDDCGNMINPMIVDGQLQGGIAQGLGASLIEELVYSPEGQLVSSTFMDYLLPTSSDIPELEIDHLITPSPLNELGLKGVGESGIIGPPAAIANAVSDALRSLRISINKTPIKDFEIFAQIKGHS